METNHTFRLGEKLPEVKNNPAPPQLFWLPNLWNIVQQNILKKEPCLNALTTWLRGLIMASSS